MGILSGLSLFLYGMRLMSESLETCANDSMKNVLLSFAHHKYYSIIIGIFLTAIMQSSSAMSVMLIGFLNSHLISLESAIWLLMGANIGTTMTGQIIALDLGKIAPILAIIGVILLLTKYQAIGEVITGLGLLFIGLELLQQGLSSINVDIFFKIDYPIIMILYGFLLTSIIQSSSASIGILQSLVVQSIIPFSKAVYLIFGFNMGSTMTGIFASLLSNRNAQRLALFHLLMNSTGTILFYILCSYTPLIRYFESMITNPMGQVAHMHTLFNVITTIIVLFIDRYLIRIINILIPHKHVLANP
ncbi:MAG: Na/Pi symporter [Erysipelotrichaceae bacterium]|nr:Na/Pi symporter [Erysipelotrichaceae bacterium]